MEPSLLCDRKMWSIAIFTFLPTSVWKSPAPASAHPSDQHAVLVAQKRESNCNRVRIDTYPEWCVCGGVTSFNSVLGACVGSRFSTVGENVVCVRWQVTLITSAEPLKRAGGFGTSERRRLVRCGLGVHALLVSAYLNISAQHQPSEEILLELKAGGMQLVSMVQQICCFEDLFLQSSIRQKFNICWTDMATAQSAGGGSLGNRWQKGRRRHERT